MKRAKYFYCRLNYTAGGRAQMGGPEGVRASERYPLVIGLASGMSMHAFPRPGVM